MIAEDKNRRISYDDFDFNYSMFYNDLGLLGKTAYDVCKVELSINKTNYLINNNQYNKYRYEVRKNMI